MCGWNYSRIHITVQNQFGTWQSGCKEVAMPKGCNLASSLNKGSVVVGMNTHISSVSCEAVKVEGMLND